MAASRAASVASREKRGVRATPEGRKADIATARKAINTSSAASAALVAEDKPLTEQQRLFARLWASGESISTATARAGYAEISYGYRMARMPNIIALYKQEKLAFERDSAMTRAKVIEGFMDGIEMARMLGEPSSMIAGWREIGRMCGYYEPVKIKHEISVEGKVMVERMESMSDDDLMKLIEQRAAAMREQVQLPAPEGQEDDEAVDAGGAA